MRKKCTSKQKFRLNMERAIENKSGTAVNKS